MLDIQINVDEAQRERVRQTFAETPKAIAKVMALAINKTLRSQRSRVVKSIAQITTVKQKDLKKAVVMVGANYKKPTGKLAVYGRRFPLIEYRARQKQAGVEVEMVRGKRTMKYGTFIATMPEGHVGVYDRAMRGTRRVPRLPIREQYGDSIPEIVRQHTNLEHEWEMDLDAAFRKNLDALTDVFVKKIAAGQKV